MAWQAQIISQQENPVPNGTVYIDVRFSDGDRAFVKGYKLSPGQFASADDVLAFIANETNQIGALYDAAAALDLTTTIRSTPKVVTNFQARSILMQMGLFEAVDAYCKATGGEVLQAWEYANNFYRTGGLVTSLAPVFGLDDAALDAVFQAASQIEA
jgi:hypothetical protein